MSLETTGPCSGSSCAGPQSSDPSCRRFTFLSFEPLAQAGYSARVVAHVLERDFLTLWQYSLI